MTILQSIQLWSGEHKTELLAWPNCNWHCHIDHAEWSTHETRLYGYKKTTITEKFV